MFVYKEDEVVVVHSLLNTFFHGAHDATGVYRDHLVPRVLVEGVTCALGMEIDC